MNGQEGSRTGSSNAMPRQKVFTPSVVAQIGCWVDEGLNATEIAEKVGCKLGTLRVRCSQLGIALRRQRVDEKTPRSISQSLKRQVLRQKSDDGRLVLSLPHDTINCLRQQALLRGTSESGLAAILLQTVAEDGLYEAVLDENEQNTGTGIPTSDSAKGLTISGNRQNNS
jgi:hypothetical protein